MDSPSANQICESVTCCFRCYAWNSKNEAVGLYGSTCTHTAHEFSSAFIIAELFRRLPTSISIWTTLMTAPHDCSPGWSVVTVRSVTPTGERGRRGLWLSFALTPPPPGSSSTPHRVNLDSVHTHALLDKVFCPDTDVIVCSILN